LYIIVVQFRQANHFPQRNHIGLQHAQYFHDRQANAHPDHDMQNRDDEADFPPLTLAHEVRTEEYRRNAAAIMREERGAIAKCAQEDQYAEYRCTSSDQNRRKGRKQGHDMRAVACEQIVCKRIDQAKDDKHRHPRHAGKLCGHSPSEPFHQAEFRQVGCHIDQHAHPDENIPSTVLLRDIRPIKDFRQQHRRQAQESDKSRIDMMDGARSPHDESSDENHAENLLFETHSAHFAELFLGQLHRLRGILDFRIDELIEDGRRRNGQDEARNDAGQEPLAPADRRAEHLLCQRIAKHVVRSTRQEDAGRRDDSRIGTEHQEGARALVLARLRIRADRRRDTADNRIDDAAAACRVGRRERGDDEVRCTHDISDAQRAAAELREQNVRNALAKARLDEALSKHECRYDQPDRRIRKTSQGLARLHDAEYRQQCTGDDSDSTDWHRLQDEACDSRDEYGKQAPGLRADTSRCRNEPDDCTNGHTHQATHQGT